MNITALINCSQTYVLSNKAKFQVSLTLIFTDRAIFKQKRAEQTFAAESILKLGDYTKQYKMVEIVLDKLFKVSFKSSLL